MFGYLEEHKYVYERRWALIILEVKRHKVDRDIWN